MNKFILSMAVLITVSSVSFAQNVGINTTSPKSRLDVNGDVAMRAGSITLTSTISDNIDISTTPYSFYNVSGIGFRSIGGFTGGNDGRVLTLHNASAYSFTLLNKTSTSLASNQIEIPGGVSLSLLPGGSVTMVYNKTSSKWNIVSSTYTDSRQSTQWSTGGNSNTFAGSNFIGTTDSADLVVKTSNTEQLRITKSGKVGVGTAAPQTTMHVNPNGAGSLLIGSDRSSGGYTDLEMGISSKSNGYGYVQATKASGSKYGNLILNPSGGRVGVGTNTPQATMDVHGGIALPIKVVQQDYTVQDGDYTIVVDMQNDLTKNLKIYLPATFVNVGRVVKIVGTNLPNTKYTLTATGIEYISPTGHVYIYDGAGTTLYDSLYLTDEETISQYSGSVEHYYFHEEKQSITLQCIGALPGWYITDKTGIRDTYFYSY